MEIPGLRSDYRRGRGGGGGKRNRKTQESNIFSRFYSNFKLLKNRNKKKSDFGYPKKSPNNIIFKCAFFFVVFASFFIAMKQTNNPPLFFSFLFSPLAYFSVGWLVDCSRKKKQNIQGSEEDLWTFRTFWRGDMLTWVEKSVRFFF